MTTPYKDLEFNLFQTFTMIRLKYFKIQKETIYSNSRYDFLRTYSLIHVFWKNEQQYCSLSEKGRMYLRHKRKELIRFWIPVTISIIALFGGYGVYKNPLLAQILQAATTLVKTISESLGAVF